MGYTQLDRASLLGVVLVAGLLLGGCTEVFYPHNTVGVWDLDGEMEMTTQGTTFTYETYAELTIYTDDNGYIDGDAEVDMVVSSNLGEAVMAVGDMDLEGTRNKDQFEMELDGDYEGMTGFSEPLTLELDGVVVSYGWMEGEMKLRWGDVRPEGDFDATLKQ